MKFTQKSLPVDNKKNDSPTIKPVDFPDFNFRVSYQMEQDYSMASDVVKNTLSKWFDSKKLFRYMNRTRFISNKYPVFVDISIVKSNKKSGKVPIPQYTIQDAGVFDAESGYEVELELDNSRIGVGTEYNTSSSIIHAIKKAIRIILGAIQGTNYPISYSERESTLQAYMKLIHGEEYQILSDPPLIRFRLQISKKTMKTKRFLIFVMAIQSLTRQMASVNYYTFMTMVVFI